MVSEGRQTRGGRDMPGINNVSHWVTLLAGLFLALTGLLLRDIISSHPLASTMPAGSRWHRKRMAGMGKRLVLIAIGLAAFAYGVSRILY